MKTLHTAYRVTDLAASLGFYTALGYGEVGRVDLGAAVCLVMLKFPGEEVELVQWPPGHPDGITTADFDAPARAQFRGTPGPHHS